MSTSARIFGFSLIFVIASLIHSKMTARKLLGALISCALVTVSALNIEDFGAVASDDSYETALANGVAIFKTFTAAQTGLPTNDGRTVWVPPGKTFSMIPAAVLNGVSDVTLRIDGNISVRTDNYTIWPMINGTSSALSVFTLRNCENFTVTGSGNVLGNGYNWWWYVILSGQDHRPNLLDMLTCKNVLIETVRWENSPMYHLFLMDMLNLTVRDMEVYVDVEGQNRLFERAGLLTDGSSGLPRGIPTFPLNTDGIDPAGKDIYITNVTITSFDDAIAVKPSNGGGVYASCSENILVENAKVIFGVGMTIGSVPPHEYVNCVRNVTFRNINFETPLKMVYIKTNPGNAGSGIIDSITYQNMYARSPIWWSVWIGPQQQHQPGPSGVDTGCSFLFPLPNNTCPTQPRVPISNVRLLNVTADSAVLSPGVILCNATKPCTGIVLQDVNVTSLSNWPVSSGYYCKNANVTTNRAYPAPICSSGLDEEVF